MTKKHKVSGKTHTKQQLDDYANQHNPNNKAFKADQLNREKTRRSSNYDDLGIMDGESYGWCDD